MKKLFAFCIALMLAILPIGAAMAETIMIYGTVINTQPQSVVCTADGTIEQVNVTVGDRVTGGTVIATVETNKVYATTDGTVYLFGEAGDKVSDITAQYGAVAYISPAQPYTITATATDRNGMAVSVIPGETVYLRCYKDGKHTGVGVLAKLEKGKYTVVVTEGQFATGETISIYRDPAYTDQSRIGRAKVTIADMVACQGDGYLVKFHVQNGATVEKGTLLYETISGTFAPGSSQHNKVVAPTNGIVSAVYEKAGSQLSGAAPTPVTTAATDDKKTSDKDTTTSTATSVSSPTSTHVIAEVYPDSSLRIVAYAPESVLSEIHVGDTVYVSCQYIENMAEPVVGAVEKISRIPAPENSGVEAQYAVYVTVSDASSFYYGMNVIVTTAEAN
ncbi:MAG: HlyD family efflux transporter periplasmic adaptor subunit [Clostridia bacterium]|nr:HlyD family efflux transporter periplasmic adaptor subunit [Clostridia bacterium]